MASGVARLTTWQKGQGEGQGEGAVQVQECDFLGFCQQASPATRGQKGLARGRRELAEPTQQDRAEQDRGLKLHRDDHPRLALLAESRDPPNGHPGVAGRRGVFTIEYAAHMLAETARSLHSQEALADPRWVPGAPGFRFGAVLVQVLVRSEFIFGSHLVQT